MYVVENSCHTSVSKNIKNYLQRRNKFKVYALRKDDKINTKVIGLKG